MHDVLRLSASTHVGDQRGRLTSVAFDCLPFVPKRAFTITEVPIGTSRGGHAHKVCEQALFCCAGTVEISVSTPTRDVTTRLTPETPGLLVPPLHWTSQNYLLEGSCLLVVASHGYDPDDYVCDWVLYEELFTRADR